MKIKPLLGVALLFLGVALNALAALLGFQVFGPADIRSGYCIAAYLGSIAVPCIFGWSLIWAGLSVLD